MGLFSVKNNLVQINPDSLPIPPFKEIWERDKTKNKEKAYQELSYCFYLCDYKSPYYSYPEDQREYQVIKDFIRDDKWKPDSLVNEACRKYNEFQETAIIRLLKAARGAVEKLIIFFQTEGYNHKSFTSNLKEMGNILKSLDMLEEKAKKEITSEEKIRGGGEIKSRER